MVQKIIGDKLVIDNRQTTDNKMLHKMSKRATPEMWSIYSTACGMYNVITTSFPEDTFVNLTENFLNSERNQGLQFTRSNRLKIGFNCLSNHLQ